MIDRNSLSLFLCCFVLLSDAWSQPTFTLDRINTSERPQARATALETGPFIDGNVLEDPVWQQLQPIGDLTQTTPNLGQPASEKTDIRIGYDNHNLYIGVVCYDSAPQKLVVTDARRDGSLENTDAISFILDTYHDGQNGFVFGTNSIGVEYDAQVDNEGQGNFNQNRQQGGMIGGFNLNWDASWVVKTQISEIGWSAEFAIPFRTIRFKPGKDRVWGINFRRNIRKSNEVAYWAPMPINFTLNRLSLAGDLTGLDLKNPGNLKLIPYALGAIISDHEVTPSETDVDGEIGADLKYSITPSLTLDLTYNTDFAQVEVDEQQINLDRFNLFFPEKRPFFLENAGQFSVGSPGEVDLFFSRRIGIGENGEQVPIIGGARLSGKLKKTNIGLLNMFTGPVEEAGIEENNFTVARVNHEFGGRSALGAAFINRQGLGEMDGDYNRTYAVDGKLGLGKKARLLGFFAKTATPGLEEADHAFQLQSRYDWNGWIITGAYTEVGEGFNPEVGFLQRTAFRKADFLVFYQLRAPETSKFLENRPHVSYRSYWNFEGFQETGFLHIDNHWVWKNGIELHTGVNFTTEGVVKPFEIFEDILVPAGSYHHKEAQLVFFTNPSKPLSINLFSILGGFFGGDRILNSASLRLRLGDKFSSEFGYTRNDISLPQGDFHTNLFRSRISYSFSPSIFVQSLVQYNNVADIWSANIRFGWVNQANTGLFVVYNENRGTDGLNNRSFIVKYSRVFDLMR